MVINAKGRIPVFLYFHMLQFQILWIEEEADRLVMIALLENCFHNLFLIWAAGQIGLGAGVTNNDE
jgi:hypothetical protein